MAIFSKSVFNSMVGSLKMYTPESASALNRKFQHVLRNDGETSPLANGNTATVVIFNAFEDTTNKFELSDKQRISAICTMIDGAAITLSKSLLTEQGQPLKHMMQAVVENYFPKELTSDTEYTVEVPIDFQQNAIKILEQILADPKYISELNVDVSIMLSPFIWTLISKDQLGSALDKFDTLNKFYHVNKEFINWYIKHALKLDTEFDEKNDIIKAKLKDDILSW